MRLVDLTMPAVSTPDQPVVRIEARRIGHDDMEYDAMVGHFVHDSMTGTYLDLPGHIRDTDDGYDAETFPPEKLFRLDARIVRLDRSDGSGGIKAEDIDSAAGTDTACECFVLNALGKRRFDDIVEYSVWLEQDAVRRIIGTGAKLLVSDVYERRPPVGVFYELFRAGVCAVCYPINLSCLSGTRARVTALMPRFKGATQIPCRILAECD